MAAAAAVALAAIILLFNRGLSRKLLLIEMSSSWLRSADNGDVCFLLISATGFKSALYTCFYLMVGRVTGLASPGLITELYGLDVLPSAPTF